MSLLIYRDVVLTVGTVQIKARNQAEPDKAKPILRVVFKVEKTDNRDPSKAEVTVYNLNKDSRTALQEKFLPTIIEAGYVGEIAQIFSGDLTFSSSTKEGTDWVTTLLSGDGSKQYRRARINESFAPGTLAKDVLKKAVGSLGLGLGNVTEKLDGGNFRGGLTEFSNGATITGRASDVIDKYATTLGFQWSIQDGQVNLLRPEETTEDEVVVLNPATGLVESPEVGDDGVVKAKSLLQGLLNPGRQVKIESRHVNGFFKMTKVTHSGDTLSGEWYSEVEGKPL